VLVEVREAKITYGSVRTCIYNTDCHNQALESNYINTARQWT